MVRLERRWALLERLLDTTLGERGLTWERLRRRYLRMLKDDNCEVDEAGLVCLVVEEEARPWEAVVVGPVEGEMCARTD
jgi:hypothetical protein